MFIRLATDGKVSQYGLSVLDDTKHFKYVLILM